MRPITRQEAIEILGENYNPTLSRDELSDYITEVTGNYLGVFDEVRDGLGVMSRAEVVDELCLSHYNFFFRQLHGDEADPKHLITMMLKNGHNGYDSYNNHDLAIVWSEHIYNNEHDAMIIVE